MGIERARMALQGMPTDRIPFFDIPTHREFLIYLTGIDPLQDVEKAVSEAVIRLDTDMLMCNTPMQPKVTGNEENLFGLELTPWKHKGSTRDDIFGYDPSRDRPNDAAGLSEDECFDLFSRMTQRDRSIVRNKALVIGSTFQTCIHYAAEDLDWEEFLILCLTEEERISKSIDRFQKASEKKIRAWARMDIELMLCHDDIASSRSTTLSPDWLRRNLIFRYRSIFRPLKEKGIPVLFMTDGNFIEVAEELVEAGADGFFLDTPCITLEQLVPVCGRDLIYFTGPSPATMTVGTPDSVKNEIAKIAELGRELPRFFFHMPGGFSRNMPMQNVLAFYEACMKYGAR